MKGYSVTTVLCPNGSANVEISLPLIVVCLLTVDVCTKVRSEEVELVLQRSRPVYNEHGVLVW